jgi:hypothetical protein
MGNALLARIDNSDTLGACMGRVYRHHVKHSEGVVPVRISQADWPRSAKSFAEALARIGSPVWFLYRFPSGTLAHLVARLDPKAMIVQLAPSTCDEAMQHQPATHFNCHGVRIRF